MSDECIQVSEIIKIYELDKLKNFTWQIQGCSGKTGEGLIDGLHWLSEKIIAKKEKFQNNPYIPTSTHKPDGKATDLPHSKLNATQSTTLKDDKASTLFNDKKTDKSSIDEELSIEIQTKK